MWKKSLSLLLVISLIAASLNITTYASEADKILTDQMQTAELETLIEPEQSEAAEETESAKSVEYTGETEVDGETQENIGQTGAEEDISEETAEDSSNATEQITQTETSTESLIDSSETTETISVSESDTETETESETEEISETEALTDTETMAEEELELMCAKAIEEYEEIMMELAADDNTYKITEHQLFMQAPQYLLPNTPLDTYLTRCFEYTRKAMEGVNETQTWWAAFMEGLKSGSEFLTKEIASACGLTDSNYAKQKKDMAGELVREYMGNKEYLSSSAEKLSKKLKGLDKIADADLKIQKENYKEQLKEVCTAMTDDEVDKAVDTVFGKLDKITGYADKAVDAFDIVTSIMANQELELEVIDNLIVSLQDSRDRDLYEGLVMIRNDVTSDIGTYILENYLTDKAIGKVKGILADALNNAVQGITGIEITTSAKVIVGVAVNVGVWCYEKYNPSVSAIMHTTIMYNYALTLETAVLKYKKQFYNKEAAEEDIECFKAAYTAELCAVKLMMKYAKGLTSSSALKNSLDIYGESIGGKEINCAGYINYVRREATKDIDAGILTVTDEGSTQKTPDGTIIDENYDPTESIRAKYAEIQKKYPPDVSRTWKESYGGAIQCFGFARMVFNLLFGCDMPSAYKGGKRYEYVDNTNVTVIGQLSGSSVTAENVKKLLQQGKLGDVTQGYGEPYGQHTMILQEVKETGATFYQCNYLNADCLIYTHFHTWESLASRYGKGDSISGNGFTLYRANNYGTIYGDGSDLFYDDSVNFVISDGVLTKYNGWQSHVEIPDTVTAIGEGAFQNNTTMMTVEIPDSVTSIGDKAFYGCTNLVGVVILDSVLTIGASAFQNCVSLENVQLSANVTSIGYWAFRDCKSLKKIEIPKSLESTTSYALGYPESSGIFYGCDNLQTILFEEGTTTIAYCLFANCDGIKQIEIPNTVTNIEGYAFYNCVNLEKLKIQNSVTNIGNSAFQDCKNITYLNISNNITCIGYWAFRDCNMLERVEIPKSLETTTSYAGTYPESSGIFYGCKNLKTIVFENGATQISYCIFANCGGIEEIDIPDTITSIESYAFYNCTNLKRVNIPDSVTKIEKYAFGMCSNMTDLRLSKRIVSIGHWAFRDCNGLREVEIPKSLNATTVYAGSYPMSSGIFYGCENLKTIVFEKGTTKISNCLFANCKGIEELIIPDTVKTIEKYAFCNCTNLKQIEIPNGTDVLENYTFSGCVSLKTVTLPNKIITIPEGMFQDCTSLEKVDFPESITTIKQHAFQNSGLTELDLPENVTTIENYAFDNCTALAKVNLNTGLKTVGNYAFRNNDSLAEITISDSVTSIGSNAFQDSDSLVSATISDSVTSIGEYVFEHCDKLKDITFGTGLTKIPSYALNLCPALEKIVLPYRVSTVEKNAFTNCTRLTEVTIPRGTTSISTSAFSYPDKLTIYGIAGTYAETYANQIGAVFVNKEVQATDIILSQTALTMLTGAKHTLVMRVIPSNFTDVVVWKSSNTDILTVDNMGVITAKAVGTANVRVAVGEKTVACTVTVVQPVTSISLDRSSLSLKAFEEYTLTASVYPSNAADKSVEWSTSDESVAIVSQSGKVTPVSKGTATITATAKDGSSKYGNCKVTVTSEGQLCTQYSDLESAHNYENNTNKIWKYVYSGAKTLDVTFDSRTNVDDGFDYIYIYDGSNQEIRKATGIELSDKSVRIIGDTVKIQLVSDEAVTAWGFKVTKIAVDGKEIDVGDETPEEPSTEEDPAEEESTEKESTEEESTEEESKTDVPEETVKDGFDIIGLKTMTFTGKAVKQDIKVYYNKHLLKEGTDYTLSYKNNVKAGKASLTIRAKGNLKGTVIKTYEIKPRKITDTNVIIEDTVYSYDKRQHKKAPVITYNGKTLKKDKDFEITDYGDGDYTEIGTYIVKIKGIGNYTGFFDNAKVIIIDKNKNLSKAKVGKIPIQNYQNGSPVTLSDMLLKVSLGGVTLKKDTDYTVTYINNREPGKATAVIKGKGQYAGTKKVNFTIKRTPTALTDSMVTNKKAISSVPIQKNGARPKPKLTAGSDVLLEGKDYTLSYQNNKKAGTGTIIIKGTGNYNKQLKIPFAITAKPLTSADLVIRVPDVPYTGRQNKYQSKPVITDSDGGILVVNRDYTITSYQVETALLDKKSNPEEGTMITVTIVGKGSYTGTATAAYMLKGTSFSKASIQVTAKPYTGNPVTIEAGDIITASIRIGKNQTILQLGKDYEIAAYKNNIKKGTATVIFKGKGAYSGEKAVKFRITVTEIAN